MSLYLGQNQIAGNVSQDLSPYALSADVQMQIDDVDEGLVNKLDMPQGTTRYPRNLSYVGTDSNLIPQQASYADLSAVLKADLEAAGVGSSAIVPAGNIITATVITPLGSEHSTATMALTGKTLLLYASLETNVGNLYSNAYFKLLVNDQIIFHSGLVYNQTTACIRLPEIICNSTDNVQLSADWIGQSQSGALTVVALPIQ